MSRNASPTRFLHIRIVGALAFLLVCGAALLGGTQKPKAASHGVWRSGTQAPLVHVKAYPKDFQRHESRRHFWGEGDDQPDQPLALEGYPHPRLSHGLRDQVARSRDEALPIESRYRLQPPRAPPLV